MTKPVTDTTLVLRYYDAAFERKFEVRYPTVPGKDAALAKQLLDLYTLEQLTAWIDQFFALEDEWIAGTTYSFGVFRSQLGKVIAMKQTPIRRPVLTRFASLGMREPQK